MLSKQPFERRILIAFVLMTVMVSGLFSLSIVGVVHFIEEHLVSQEMSRELGETLNEDIRQGRPPRLDSSTQFFSSYHDQYLIPEQYTGLQQGFNEVVSGNEAFYVYVQKINGETYMLVQEQQEFEARENALFNVVLAGFLLTVVAAWGLGLMMARKVMAPISRLPSRCAIAISCIHWHRHWHRIIPTMKSASWPPPSTARWARCASPWSASGCSPATSATNYAHH